MNNQAKFKMLDDKLAALGVTRVEADYSGYGDEYNGIEAVFYQGVHRAKYRDMDNEVRDFLDALVDARHDGFWNNSGGHGSFIWNVGGTLEHEHSDVVEDYETTKYKGVGE